MESVIISVYTATHYRARCVDWVIVHTTERSKMGMSEICNDKCAYYKGVCVG